MENETQNALQFRLATIEGLIGGNQVEEALAALLDIDKNTQAGIAQDVILASGNFQEAKTQYDRQLISFDEYSRYKARTRYALSELMKDIPRRVSLNARIRGLSSFQFEIPDTQTLEAVLGQTSHLLKIGWLDKARAAANTVCRVVCEGNKFGTGFLAANGYVFTNNHVIASVNEAKSAHLEFDYEEGKAAKVYQLDATDFKTSPSSEFDFTRIKVVDRVDAPLRQWGFVEFEPEVIPTIGEAVTIIQHPEGQEKQIALTANQVISQMNQYLYYTTDTKGGSSGSPVFNNNWKVVAIHHAGKRKEDGGLTIDNSGTKEGANRGVLVRDILKLIS